MSKNKINAKLDFVITDFGNYEKKAQMAIASGEDYDIMFSATWMNDYIMNSTKGAFLPLEDMLPKYAPDVMRMVAPSGWDALKVGGHVYGIPKLECMAHSQGILVQQPMAEKYGLDISKINKLEELEPFMEKMLAAEKGKYMWELNKSSDFLGYYLYTLGYLPLDGAGGSGGGPLGIKLEDPDAKVVNLLEQPEVKAFYDMARRWYTKGYMRKDSITIDSSTTLVEGNLIFHPAGNFYYGIEKAIVTKDAIPYVGKRLTSEYLVTSEYTGATQCISKNSKNPERALMLLNLLWQDKDFYRLMENGIKDKHYTVKEENGVESVIPNIDAGYNLGATWELGPAVNDYLKAGMAPDTYEKWAEETNNAKPSPILGFSFNPESVKTQVAQVQALYSQYAFALGMGAVDPAKNLPEYADKLKGAGIDNIMTEAQRQIDEWKAARK